MKFFHTLSLENMQKDSYLLSVFLIFEKIIKVLFIPHHPFKQRGKLNKLKQTNDCSGDRVITPFDATIFIICNPSKPHKNIKNIVTSPFEMFQVLTFSRSSRN